MDDAEEMSAVFQQLAALEKRDLPSDVEFVRSMYIAHADNIQCTVSQDDDGSILGIQILKRAVKDNIYGVDAGWGIIGTHVRADAGGRGVAKGLFAATVAAAKQAGVQHIDASIPAQNLDGQAFYDAIGFRTYRTPEGKVCKKYDVI